ncbi:hypothetical protein C8R45DRAFT_936014 [Mycena sanguinolenta]|nr:hypothetical protein C8R45DRAFT_936014 [Mycena sanguinolenta]
MAALRLRMFVPFFLPFLQGIELGFACLMFLSLLTDMFPDFKAHLPPSLSVLVRTMLFKHIEGRGHARESLGSAKNRWSWWVEGRISADHQPKADTNERVDRAT